jgi:hypothetical protein
MESEVGIIEKNQALFFFTENGFKDCVGTWSETETRMPLTETVDKERQRRKRVGPLLTD